MEKIAVMSRDLDMTNRIQIHSIPELKDGLAHATTRISRVAKFRGRKLGVGPLLNAVTAQFLRLSEEQQEALAVEGLKLLETLLEHDEPRDDLVAPGSSPHHWSMAGPEGDPPVESGVALHARVSRRDSKAKRKNKSTDPA